MPYAHRDPMGGDSHQDGYKQGDRGDPRNIVAFKKEIGLCMHIDHAVHYLQLFRNCRKNRPTLT